MGFWKKLAASAVSALAISACGVPMEGDEALGSESVESADEAASVEQGLTCADPGDYNFHCVMGSSCAGSRTRSQILSCPAGSSDTTVMQIDGVYGERYTFSAYATFTASNVIYACQGLDNKLAVRIQKRVNGSWVEMRYYEIRPVWSNGRCTASLQVDPGTNGSGADDYRLRVKGIRHDGTPEGVTLTIVRAN